MAALPEKLGSDPLGVAGYLSPEQALGGAIDERSDLFSLGVILHEMITGRNPFAGPTPAATVMNIVSVAPPAASGANPSMPADLSALVSRALAKSVDARPRGAVAIASELRRIAAALDVREGNVQLKELIPVAPKRSSGWWLALLVMALLAITAWWISAT